MRTNCMFCSCVENRTVPQERISEVKRALTLRNLNALSSEQPRIHRPRSRPEHRQCSSQSAKQDVYPRIVGMREGERQLRYRHQYTRDRCPETNQQQRCGACGDQVGGKRRQSSRDESCSDAMLNGWNHCYCSQEQEAGSWPTLRKCRKKPLHNWSRFQTSFIRNASKP
jgi:hypothetical protein